MAEKDEEDDLQSARLKHFLLIEIKKTVEGLLATNTSNVWNTFGGLSRLCKHVENILNHRLKFVVGDYGSVVDYWPFVKGLKWLNPVMTPFIEKIRKGPHQKGVSKGQVWVKMSLMEHNLSAQLKTLVTNEPHLRRHYFDDAFLFSPKYFKAMCICLQAVEENNVSLLAEIDAKLLNFNPSATRVVPSPIRSASLPVAYSPSNLRQSDTQRSSFSDAMSLAPPFASPPCTESILCTSDEHAVPCNIASSTSPEESRLTAKEALRNVLRKSGSDSPPPTPTPIVSNDTYSFYDSLNIDPLMNLGFLQGSRSPSNSVGESHVIDKTVDDFRSKSEKKVLTRSASEDLVAKRQRDRRASEMMNKLLVDDSDNVFPVTKSLTLQSSASKEKLSKASRVIFSDSEGMDKVEKAKSGKSKHSKMTHKRSRSDISGIKLSVTQDEEKGTENTRSSVEDKSKDKSNLDETDSSTGGFFPQPAQGQSLIQYLSSQDFHTCANLDKENAHFSICEALIAAIEQMKWNHVIGPTDSHVHEEEEEESDEEIKQLRQRIRIRKRERLKEKARGFPAFSDGRTDTATTTSRSHSDSPFSSSYDSNSADSEDSSGLEETQIELTMEESSNNLMQLKNSGLSLSMASLYSDADIKKTVHLQRNISVQETGNVLSAESVAISLLKKFSEKQLPKASDLQWLVTEQDAPQRLLPLPNSYPVSPDDADDSSRKKTSRTRLRGNLEWAPPRPQIIFNIHPPPKRNYLLVKQNYRCAGCGMKVEPGYAKRYRYCEYLGKYFCQCCHSNNTMVIPARILKRWDFTKYYVSNFSKDFLTKIFSEPLFNIADINPALYRKVRLLDHIKDWRTQLMHLNSLLGLCKKPGSVMSEINSLSRHWMEDIHSYSLSDLISVKNGVSGTMYSQIKSVTTSAINHVDSCPQHFSHITDDRSVAHMTHYLKAVGSIPSQDKFFQTIFQLPLTSDTCEKVVSDFKRMLFKHMSGKDRKALFCQGFGFICEMCKNQHDIIFPFQLQKVVICQGCKSCFHKGCFVPQKCPKCARIEARRQKLEEETAEDKEENTVKEDDR